MTSSRRITGATPAGNIVGFVAIGKSRIGSSRVFPNREGGRGPNPLSWFNRWKIFDNLRRSLLPATSLGLLIASWLTSPRLGWIATLVVAMQLLFHPLAQPFTMATTRQGLKGFSFSKVAHDLLRAVADAALLPHQAGLALDAIVRVWYRRLISHRGLLEWTSAQVMHGSAPRQHAMVRAFHGPGEPLQRDRGLGGAALDAVQPCDGQPLARACGSSPR